MTDPLREFARHTVATLAYRGGKTLVGAPDDFADYTAGPGTRTPGEILAHVGDLLDWALWLCFFGGLERLDLRLTADQPLGCPVEKLFQGPIADALTHVGQLAMLRRMAGGPVRAENYYRADIVAGRVGPELSGRRVEFD